MLRFAMKARCLIAIAACGYADAGLAASAVPEAPPQDEVFQQVAGKWAWSVAPDQCKENPHYISFSADRKTATFRLDRPFARDGQMISEYSYSILSAEGNTLTMRMDGETRRTDRGEPVVWVLVLRNPTTYAWRRTDWEPSRLTENVGRCD